MKLIVLVSIKTCEKLHYMHILF